jgi:hypothetical protein
MHCREHVVQLHDRQQTLLEQDIETWVVSFSERSRVRHWVEAEGLTFPILHDPDRKVYQAYQLESSFFRTWSPRNIWSYIVAFFQGKDIVGIIGDPHQLGADLLIGPEGKILMGYYSQDPVDRPSLEEIIQAVQTKSSSTGGNS